MAFVKNKKYRNFYRLNQERKNCAQIIIENYDFHQEVIDIYDEGVNHSYD